MGGVVFKGFDVFREFVVFVGVWVGVGWGVLFFGCVCFDFGKFGFGFVFLWKVVGVVVGVDKGEVVCLLRFYFDIVRVVGMVGDGGVISVVGGFDGGVVGVVYSYFVYGSGGGGCVWLG